MQNGLNFCPFSTKGWNSPVCTAFITTSVHLPHSTLSALYPLTLYSTFLIRYLFMYSFLSPGPLWAHESARCWWWRNLIQFFLCNFYVYYHHTGTRKTKLSVEGKGSIKRFSTLLPSEAKSIGSAGCDRHLTKRSTQGTITASESLFNIQCLI